MVAKLTTEEVVRRFREKHGDRYDYSSVEYIDSLTKVVIRCEKHGIFKQKPHSHMQGNKCPGCESDRKFQTGAMRTRAAANRFVEDAKKIHGNKYNYDLMIYKKSSIKIIIDCPKHGPFHQTPNTHLNGSGCLKCGIEKLSKLFIFSKEEFVERAINIHGNKYCYDFVEYKGYDTPIKIICNIHQEFEQTPHAHLNNGGCKKCGNEVGALKNTINKEEFIAEARLVHGKKYDYSKVEYTNCKAKITIICPIHGDFEQTADNHLYYGCGRCGGTKKLNTTMFIEAANKIHIGYYTYESSDYIAANKQITITCPLHGSFQQLANSHLMGSGCKKCSHMISDREIDWLNSLSIPNLAYQFKLDIKYGHRNYIMVDGFDFATNTVYEFYGDFWHGNPMFYDPNDINIINHKTFGELYNKTICRENAIVDAGYNIVYIWENEWMKQQRNNK